MINRQYGDLLDQNELKGAYLVHLSLVENIADQCNEQFFICFAIVGVYQERERDCISASVHYVLLCLCALLSLSLLEISSKYGFYICQSFTFNPKVGQ
mgnify:CR=1 FL=1